MRKLLIYIFILILSITSITCGDDNLISPAPPVSPVICSDEFTVKSDRLFGMDILNMSETGSFEDNIASGKVAGMEFIGVHLTWTQIEADGGSGTTSGTFIDPNGTIKAFIDVVKANDLKFSLTIRPIDLTGKTVPSDLDSNRFDDAENTDLQTRFKALLDFVLNIKGSDETTTIQSYLTSLQIGNEIDGYDTSSEHAEFWSHYGNFLFNIKTHVHININSNIKVGYTATLHGATSESKKTTFQALSGAVDVTGITYYPIDDSFNVKDHSIVSADLQTLVETFPGRTIYLQEVGYQTSSVNNSSQAKQAEFFCSFFQGWDTHKDTIKLVNIVRLQDISETDAADMALPYGLGSESFKEYLQTLGLRTFSGAGEDKEAYGIIKGETEKRGW